MGFVGALMALYSIPFIIIGFSVVIFIACQRHSKYGRESIENYFDYANVNHHIITV